MYRVHTATTTTSWKTSAHQPFFASTIPLLNSVFWLLKWHKFQRVLPRPLTVNIWDLVYSKLSTLSHLRTRALQPWNPSCSKGGRAGEGFKWGAWSESPTATPDAPVFPGTLKLPSLSCLPGLTFEPGEP